MVTPTPGHDLFSSSEHAVQVLYLHVGRAGIVPTERGEVLRRESGIKNGAGRVHHRTGIKRSTNATFAVVSHEQAAELQSSALNALALGIPLPHFSVGVLQVAGLGARTEVAPASNDAVAQEAIVCLVRPTLEIDVGDSRRPLCSGDRWRWVPKSGPPMRMVAPSPDDQWALEMCAGFYDSPRSHDDTGPDVTSTVAALMSAVGLTKNAPEWTKTKVGGEALKGWRDQ